MTLIGVTGGRFFNDKALLFRVLNSEVPVGGVIVHGDCWERKRPIGADYLADTWAVITRHDVIRVPALWDAHDNAAGPRRNTIMSKLPLSKLIAFPGDRGTRDMMTKARAKGIPVVEVTG